MCLQFFCFGRSRGDVSKNEHTLLVPLPPSLLCSSEGRIVHPKDVSGRRKTWNLSDRGCLRFEADHAHWTPGRHPFASDRSFFGDLGALFFWDFGNHNLTQGLLLNLLAGANGDD